MRVAAVIVALLALLVIAGAAVWFASERHYEACIRGAEAANPVTTEEIERSLAQEYANPYLRLNRNRPKSVTRTVGVEERRAAIDECSRWPF